MFPLLWEVTRVEDELIGLSTGVLCSLWSGMGGLELTGEQPLEDK